LPIGQNEIFKPLKMAQETSVMRYRKLIGSRLKAIRLDRKESLKKAAEGIGIAVKTLRTIENGEVNWWLLTVYRICLYYQVNVSDLFAEGNHRKLKI
jgi:DNA-binding XRE family transcriptional regulator